MGERNPEKMPRVIARGDFVEIVIEGSFSLPTERHRQLFHRSSIRMVQDRTGWAGEMVHLTLDDFGKKVEVNIWDNYDRVVEELSPDAGRSALEASK